MTATTRPDPSAGTPDGSTAPPRPTAGADGKTALPARASLTGDPAAVRPDPAPGAADAEPRRRWRRRRGTAVTGCSVLLAAGVAGHGLLPRLPGRLSSLAETLLPWSALAVPVLVAAALLRRASVAAVVALLVPTAAWLAVFGGALADKSSPGGDLTVVSHNVNQANPDPAGTARSLLAAGADVLALEELSPATAPAYERALADAYPYHFQQGTVGLWSVHPLRDARAVPIMPWTRAMRATVDAPGGRLAVYVAHLPSVRVGPSGFTSRTRDEVLGLLAAEVRAEPVRRVVVMGDLNGSTDDRALRPLTDHLVSAQTEAGAGFGFTWPARLPAVRIDQILLGGVRAASAWTLPATASDHLPVAARIILPPEPGP
ncbi:endonuclease/exonuclease/phosphatase family protein [Streptomyces sp. NPDC088090]|uniref:endonuclease/exonuclease/phosphatase family protein n=1 Tax=Streptomyces sp. NPDC088090 TaxID=3365822 RepID=UPI00384E57DB